MTKFTPIEKAAMRLQSDFHVKICERAEKEIKGWKKTDRQSFMMDLSSIPELDLVGLLAASPFDFAHDVCGIRRHMIRDNWPGKLGDFVPRYARGE